MLNRDQSLGGIVGFGLLEGLEERSLYSVGGERGDQ